MVNKLTIDELTEKTGLSKSRLRYIEARYPFYINRRLFDPDGRFYTDAHVDAFKNVEEYISNSPIDCEKDKNLSRKLGKIIVFASGKGGVGKTSLSVNLSVVAASKGYKTILLDGDLGMADAHVLLGVQPKKNIINLFNLSSVKELITETHYGLKFIPGGSGLFDLANLNDDSLNFLTEQVSLLRKENDFIFIDSPAGIGKNVLAWIMASQKLIVVTTPSPTALLDAYGLIKVSCEKDYLNPIEVIINNANSYIEGENIFKSLNQCSEKFLNRSLFHSGTLRKDSRIEKALIQRKPAAMDVNSNMLSFFYKILHKILEIP